MKSEGWLFQFHPVIQHFVTLLPAIAIPVAHRHKFTHPHTGVLLISLAVLMAGGGPYLTGQGEYHPGAPWHTLFTSISGWQALIVPAIVSSMLTILGVRLSKKRLRYRAELRERLRVTQELIDQPHSSNQGQVAEAVVDNTLAPTLPDPETS